MDESLMVTQLLYGAQKFALSAMNAHADQDEEVFLLHAGVSIERLAKAALAIKSVFLLLELKGNEETLFHLTGIQDTTQIRTVSAAQAISRLRKMGRLPTKDQDLDQLIDLRNGVAHLTAAAEESFDGLKVFVRNTNLLLENLPSKKEDYWGPCSSIAGAVMDEATEKAEHELARLIEQARYRLDQMFKRLPLDVAEGYVQSKSIPLPTVNTRSMQAYICLPRECPACTHIGTLRTGEPTLIRKGEPGEAYPFGFSCMVCQLSIWKPEVLAAAGMADRVRLVDLDGNRLLSDEEELRLYRHNMEIKTAYAEAGFSIDSP